MSYSIGPLMGKVPKVAEAVKKYVDSQTGQSREEAAAAAAFILPQLSKLPDDKVVNVRAYGSSYVSDGKVERVNHFIEVGQFTVNTGVALPTLVE
jgi:hypothetical protein